MYNFPSKRARKDQVKRREPGITSQPPTQIKNATVHSLQVNAPDAEDQVQPWVFRKRYLPTATVGDDGYFDEWKILRRAFTRVRQRWINVYRKSSPRTTPPYIKHPSRASSFAYLNLIPVSSIGAASKNGNSESDSRYARDLLDRDARGNSYRNNYKRTILIYTRNDPASVFQRIGPNSLRVF